MMVRDQVHKLVDDLFALREALLGEHLPPEARAHFGAARRELLLGVRAAAEHACKGLAAEETAGTAGSGAQSIPVEN